MSTRRNRTTKRTMKQSKRTAAVSKRSSPGPAERPALDRSGTLPQAHVGRPVRGCKCLQCSAHRHLNRQAEREFRLAQAAERGSGRLVTTTASASLADCLMGRVIHRG